MTPAAVRSAVPLAAPSGRARAPALGPRAYEVAARGRWLLGALSVLAWVGVWQWLASQRVVSPIILSPPADVARAAIALAASGELWKDFLVSGRELVAGLALAAAAAVPLGMIAGRHRRVAWIIQPFLSALFATPVIIFAPLIVAWMGIGFWDKVVLIFLEGFLQLFVTVNAGVRALDDAWLRVARGFNAGEAFVFRTVIAPGSIPYIITGARLAMGRGLVTVIVAELLASTAGLGYLIMVSGQTFKTANVYVGLLVIALLGLGIDQALRRIEARVQRWRPSA